MSERITFDEIRPGDRIRAVHQVGANSKGFIGNSVTRTVAGQVTQNVLNKAWVNDDAHTIVHASWRELEIYRLPVIEV